MGKSDKLYEVLAHTADLKIRVYGESLEELFSNAVNGMFEAIGPIVIDVGGDRGDRGGVIERKIDVHSHDLESLLVDYLSEVLYLSDVHGEAYSQAVIEEISNVHVKGVLKGVKISDFEMGEIKAVTHHGLKVVERDGEWLAEVLFDL